MPAFDPEIHHRRSIRLPGYDYSSPGAYFVTLCVEDHASLFGRVSDRGLVPSEAGQMVAYWWNELRRKFSSCDTDAFVLMPNHIHGVIMIGEGASRGGHAGPPLQAHDRTPLGRIVQWFKTMTTNSYIRGVDQAGWPPFEGRLWQRNYYEHIVRDDEDLARIREYIENNPRRCLEEEGMIGR